MSRVRLCQFPLWEGDLPRLNELEIKGRHYCHAPTLKHSSYCPYHHTLCRDGMNADTSRSLDKKHTF